MTSRIKHQKPKKFHFLHPNPTEFPNESAVRAVWLRAARVATCRPAAGAGECDQNAETGKTKSAIQGKWPLRR